MAFFVALATILALAIPLVAGPLVGDANAQTPGPGTLDIVEEIRQNQTGTTHTLTANITGSNVTNTATLEVDFEIDCTTSCADAATNYVIITGSTGTTSPIDTPTEGDQTPGTVDDTRTSPEMSCTATITNDPDADPNDGTGSCTVSYQRHDAGDDSIAGWLDHTGGNAFDESDAAEHQCAVASQNGDACSVPAGGAGNETEPDDTDVVLKNWFDQGAVGVLLDCDDETGNASNNANLSDNQTNPVGQSEIYTCKATRPDGPDQGSERDPASGILIDAEQAGANDPDNRDFNQDPNTTADRNPACTTDASGVCTFTLTTADNEAGEAFVCFWHDSDNDNAYDDETVPASPNQQADGSECDDEAYDVWEGSGEGSTTWGAGGGDDATDVVRKFWGESGDLFIDANPEYDQNVQGTQHTITATVTDDFGNPEVNVPVDFEIQSASRNDSSGQGTGSDRVVCDNTTTNAQGVATCNYTDVGTGTNPITPNTFETDVINVCVAQPPTVGEDCDENEDTDEDFFNTDEIDQVEKFWFNQTPTATTLFVDMDPTGGDCGGVNDFDETANNTINDGHIFCVEVRDQNGAADPGEPVTVTLTGPGEFWVDSNGNDSMDAGEGQGKTANVNTDEDGEVFLLINSLEAGTTTITATAENASDTGTKIWESREARTLDCSPETAVNAPGDTHTVSCTARDRDGNVAPGVQLQAIETGTGNFVNCADTGTDFHYGQQLATCDTATDNQGVATFQTTSAVEGSQTIEVAVEDDADDANNLTQGAEDRGGAPADANNACDMRAGESDDGGGVGNDAGAPAGVCFDSVAKTWDEDVAECSDGQDNDNDGEIDFPDDPGCDSANDNNEDDDDEPGPTPRACQDRGPNDGNVITGTPGADVLRGTNGRDIICGAGGDDAISARGGADLVVGNGGDDVIGGGGGRDNLAGNKGADTISGGGKSDAVKGNNGNDTLKGNKGVDSLTGGDGNDSLQGAGAGDILKGGDGSDTLRGGKGPDLLDGGAGRDQCFGGPGRDELRRCE